MKNGTNDVKLDLEPNSKPYLLKRIISDGFDTVMIFVLFMALSALVFASPLANVYNTHYENYKKIQDSVKEEYGDDAAAITEKLNNDWTYRDEQFAANVPQEIDVPEGEMPEPAENNADPEAIASASEPVYQLTFTIHGTRAQLKAAALYIKEYLNKEGLRYE